MFLKLKTSFFSRLDVRLTLASTLILLALSLGLCIFFYMRIEYLLEKQLNRILADETHELLDDIAEHKNVIRGCQMFESDVARRKYYQFEFRVLTAEGAVLYQSKRAWKMPFPDQGHKREFSTVHVPGKSMPYRLFERKMTLDEGSDLYVQIATEKRQEKDLLDRFYEHLLLAFPVVLLLSLLCGMMVANKPRKIIKGIARVANRISSQNFQERLPVPPAPDEVQELTLTINSMIDRLEKSFGEIKQFTADVSHELRNPLFALKGTMEVALSEERDSTEYRESMAECLERVNFLIKMVNDLFLISRFEMQKVNLDVTSFNMGEVVRDLHEFFLPMAQEKQLQFICERCDYAVICGDRTRILQLLSNLLDNAIKFTPEGGQVTIMLIKNESGIELQVHDTGIGIPQSALPHIFNRFYQVDSSRSASASGTGLGLQICKRIADAHGGMLSVQTNRDAGVTFTVMLPSQAKG
ncbi:MAG: HAMP domain-containing protein [Deltaproteobacteria bacterium]|nr:HAMP domain-containing protein [Deltaproteobacteria bacterium]